MTDPEPSPVPPNTLHEEAEKPTQDTMGEQREALGDEPQAGDAGGHS